MTAPSIPRCGRLDSHSPHTWTRQPLWWESPRTFPCPGVVVTEMSGDAEDRELEQLAAERHDEWWSE